MVARRLAGEPAPPSSAFVVAFALAAVAVSLAVARWPRAPGAARAAGVARAARGTGPTRAAARPPRRAGQGSRAARPASSAFGARSDPGAPTMRAGEPEEGAAVQTFDVRGQVPVWHPMNCA